jgi:hypothetical protein
MGGPPFVARAAGQNDAFRLCADVAVDQSTWITRMLTILPEMDEAPPAL